MNIEQYLAYTDYALWEVILNGNSTIQMSKDEADNEIEVPLVTAQQILARTRERKAKSTLHMAILDEHLARFHGIKYAKTLWAAIKTRFGGNAESKKMQKTVLKQQFKFFCVSNSEGLEKRNKPGIDTLDIDDLYNNLKVYEADIKGSSGSSSNSQNVAFVSAESTNNTNELNAAYSVSTATEDLEQIDQDALEEMDLKWQVAMLSMRVKRFYKKTRRKLEFNGKDPVGFDKTRLSVLIVIEDDTLLGIADQPEIQGTGDRLGIYDWSYQVEEEATDFALMAFTLNPSSSSSFNSEDIIVNLMKKVLDIKEEEVTKTMFDNHSSAKDNSVANDRFKKGEGYHAVHPPLTGNYMPPKPDLSFAGLDDSIYKFKISETVTSLAKDENDASETSTAFVEKPKEDRSIFTRSGRIPVSTAKPKAATSTSAAKPVNTAGPKQSVNFSRTISTFHKSHSPIRRSFNNVTTHSRRNSIERVNTAGSKAVSAVKGNRVTAVKTSVGYVWRPRVNDHLQQALKNKRKVDSGCSRHMTGNKAYLADYQEIYDGGFVAFGSSRGPHNTNGNADEKPADDKPKDDTGSKTVKEPVNKDDQTYKDELNMLMSQEKEASDAVDALRKDNPVNATSTSGTYSAGGPSSPHPDAFIPANTLLHVDQDDS
uniref:Ribonuclease H-like domain-containing protein n=1 Tax=Tanacetum cinerariifolium TaxID=118510 RepID=A0A6L2LIG1_TANCI|nr:ribonuclease H-like domain-containing protein [Tanacetum cinerariifolium]